MKRILIAAALLTLPVTGAFAQGDRGGYGFDTVQSPIHYQSVQTRMTPLDSSLRAAETNLDARVAGGLGPNAEIKIRAEIANVRSAVKNERVANGGVLSETSHRDLSDRLQIIQRNIHSAR